MMLLNRASWVGVVAALALVAGVSELPHRARPRPRRRSSRER